MAVSFLDRHTLAVLELFRATIEAIERAELPLGNIHAAAEEQTAQHEEGGEERRHRTSLIATSPEGTKAS